MQVQQQVSVEVALKVSYLSQEQWRVALVAVAPYAEGKRTATMTIEVPDPPAAFLDACEELLKQHGDVAARRALSAANEAQGVAQRRGELR